MIEKLLDYQLRERIAKEAYDKLLAERDALRDQVKLTEERHAKTLAAGRKMRAWLRDHANTPCVNDWDALPPNTPTNLTASESRDAHPDTVRLDWLEKAAEINEQAAWRITVQPMQTHKLAIRTGHHHAFGTLRAAIDAAMESARR